MTFNHGTPSIYGGIGVDDKRVRISCTSFNTGTYYFTSTSNNTLVYSLMSRTINLSAVSGQLNITSNENKYISGNFTAQMIAGPGSFKNTPVQF
jgi:hypothetical protein